MSAMAIWLSPRITGELMSPMVISKYLETVCKFISAVAFCSGVFQAQWGIIAAPMAV
jgi:hypothetical protein